MKKNYVSPSIKTEMIEIGVFGYYGNSGGSGGNGHGGGRRGRKIFDKWL